MLPPARPKANEVPPAARAEAGSASAHPIRSGSSRDIGFDPTCGRDTGYRDVVNNAAFFVAWAIGAAASIAVFLHATKHGNRHATAWGVGVFLFMGLGAPLYVLHVRRTQPGGKRRY